MSTSTFAPDPCVCQPISPFRVRPGVNFNPIAGGVATQGYLVSIWGYNQAGLPFHLTTFCFKKVDDVCPLTVRAATAAET